MERKIKEVTEKIVDFFFKKKFVHVLGFILGLIVGIPSGVWYYDSLDTTPPTYYDYKELYDQKESYDEVLNNIRLLLEDSNINTISGMEIPFENDEC